MIRDTQLSPLTIDLTLRAEHEAKSRYARDVLRPAYAAFAGFQPSADEDADYRKLHGIFGQAFYNRIGTGRRARADHLAGAMMTAHLLGLLHTGSHMALRVPVAQVLEAKSLRDFAERQTGRQTGKPESKPDGPYGGARAVSDQTGRQTGRPDGKPECLRIFADKPGAETLEDPETFAQWLKRMLAWQGITPSDFRPRALAEAIRIFGKKTIYTSDDFAKLAQRFRNRAFRVWQVNDLGVVQALRDHTLAAVERQEGFTTFLERMQGTLREAQLPERPLWHATTVYRKQVVGSMVDGKNRVLRSPVALKLLPMSMYETRGDSSVRPSHAALHGFILPSDDPWWETHEPGQWEWGCRCTKRPLTAKQAADYADKYPDKSVNGGFLNSDFVWYDSDGNPQRGVPAGMAADYGLDEQTDPDSSVLDSTLEQELARRLAALGR
jgi:hypothetical protein